MNWRERHAADPDLWFALTLARFVNWPDTLREIGFPVPWKPEHFLQVMSERRARGAKLYNSGAYMIRGDNREGRPTPAYQVADVFGPLWRDRRELRPRSGETLARYHERLGEYHGMGGFMAAQVVADLKYVEPLRSAADWTTFAVSGPGGRQHEKPKTSLDYRLTIAADDDWKTKGNPGLMKGLSAARAANALIAVPYFGDKRKDKWTDFNDLHVAFDDGLDAGRSDIEAAVKPDEMVEKRLCADPHAAFSEAWIMSWRQSDSAIPRVTSACSSN